ncbi:MAG: nucleotidyltransferase family protein [Ornithinimicrobium sp.]
MSMPTAHRVTGLLLAAGQGSRMGSPKAVVEVEGRTLTERAVDVLLDGGCANVLVVLGADAQRVRARLEAGRSAWGDRVRTAECANWAGGVSESLRTGLAALAARGRRCPQATLIHLVDLPDIGADVVGRVLDQGREGGWSTALSRAAYQGRAGHPALLGVTHWQGVMDTAVGDRGAGPYMRHNEAVLVDCDDLSHGADIDTPAELAAYLDGRRSP